MNSWCVDDTYGVLRGSGLTEQAAKDLALALATQRTPTRRAPTSRTTPASRRSRATGTFSRSRSNDCLKDPNCGPGVCTAHPVSEAEAEWERQDRLDDLNSDVDWA